MVISLQTDTNMKTIIYDETQCKLVRRELTEAQIADAEYNINRKFNHNPVNPEILRLCWKWLLHAVPREISVVRAPEQWIIVQEHAVDFTHDPSYRKELGYVVVPDFPIFPSRSAAASVINEEGFDLGWVAVTVNQILPNLITDTVTPISVILDPVAEITASQVAFEAWANKHGGISLEKREDMENETKNLFPATYWSTVTEISWRAWANKPKT